MKKTLFLFIFVFVGFSLSAQNEIFDEVIVLLEEGEEIGEWLKEVKHSGLRFKKTLSKKMNIHLLGWEDEPANPLQLLGRIKKSRGIALAQFNHRVELRDAQATIPNDPFFDQQWGLNNTGQGGSTADADIDAPEAWDLSRGGTSILGDTLVVAVIDDGFFLGHSDILYWKNRGEIPNNGIDDDSNGYVDDYDGWNAYLDNGFVSTASHGTEVAGIIGGIADNNLGIAGVGWETAIMPVMGLTANEATVIEAYSYILDQRLLYEQSRGARGAFVVATNASFGVNNGNPADFPIWCSIFDFLGQAGILNVAATTNANVNVDAVGDIPTACTSDFLISVTSTNALDQRSPSSGFGQVSIDLGAPGSGIYTTFASNSYGSVSGTSFASPMVAGVIPLLYAAACPNLSADYLNHPAKIALQIREMLLNGTDLLSSLSNQVATDGRLNAFQPLQILLDSCNNYPNDCVPPYRLSAQALSDTSLSFEWSLSEDSLDSKIRFRLIGTNQWDSLLVGGKDTLLDGFLPCSSYEWQVSARCDSGWSPYAPADSIRTLGCCTAPQMLELEERTDSSLLLRWPSVFGATQYQLEYRAVDSSVWTSVVLADTLLSLDSLSNCTPYEIRLWSLCSRAPFDSLKRIFTTSGCGGCTDLAYCEARGTDVSLEWIDSISLGPIQLASGANGGYGDFTSENYELLLDSLYQLGLFPGYNGGSFTEKWRIWIDGNFDGQFDSTELVVDSDPKRGPVFDSLLLPAGFQEGITRMRVAMRWAGFSLNDVPAACGVYSNGEVEDYCVTLKRTEDIYCEASSEGLGTAWIEAVSIDTVANQSGLDTSGYRLFGTPIPLKKGIEVPIKLIPQSIIPQPGRWTIWVDWNRDSTFAQSEIWLDSLQSEADTLKQLLSLPLSALLGQTRLRLILRRDSMPAACGNFAFGEVEDYVLDIQDASSQRPARPELQIRIFPNPADKLWRIESDFLIEKLELFDLEGRSLLKKEVLAREAILQANYLRKGIYLLNIQSQRGTSWQKVIRQ